MKWGRKKVSFTSPHHHHHHHPSLITRVFPSSWFSKFKQKGSSFEPPKSAKAKQKVPPSCSLSHVPWKEGRFYCGDDDPYWRLSFGEEGMEQSKVWLNSVWDDPDDNVPEVTIPNSGSSKPEAVQMFNHMVREMQEKKESLLENEEFGREKVRKGEKKKSTCRQTIEGRRSRKLNRRTLEEKQEKVANTAEKIVFEVQPEKIIHTREDFSKSGVSESRYQHSFSFPNSNLRTIEEECTLKTRNLETSNAFSKVEEAEEEEISLQCKRLEEMMLKTERQRESVYVDRNCRKKRRKQSSRIKCFSPRTAAKIECKIRALEDMKKAKMREKKTKETALREAAILDSYAVAKSSFNPQKDFRDSMIEMIIEKGIETPEELEELLACYLTLNCDEYHDLIIEVFRQVYFELNQVYLASELQTYLLRL